MKTNILIGYFTNLIADLDHYQDSLEFSSREGNMLTIKNQKNVFKNISITSSYVYPNLNIPSKSLNINIPFVLLNYTDLPLMEQLECLCCSEDRFQLTTAHVYPQFFEAIKNIKHVAPNLKKVEFSFLTRTKVSQTDTDKTIVDP